jgi:HTH-type transcriptional regulator, quorum sensing regulator NprR
MNQSIATPRAPVLDPPHATDLRLGRRLRYARLARNLTQREVAKNQFSVSYISAVERGQIRPSLGALGKLAERLQVPMADLLSKEEFAVRHAVSSRVARQSSAERQRDRVESTLREAQILLYQGRSAKTIELLLRLSGQPLTPRDMALLQLTLASCYRDQERAEDMLRVAVAAIPQAERAGERQLAERLRSAMGQALSLMQSHEAALEQYQRCLRAVQERSLQDPGFQLDLLLKMANEYSALVDYAQAMSCLEQAAALAEEQILQPERLASVYCTISRGLAANGDHAGAKCYAVRSLAAYETAAHRQVTTSVYTHLGKVLARTGQTSEAFTQLKTAGAMAARQHDLRGIAEAQRDLAQLYLEEKQTSEAERAALESLAAAELLGDAVLQAGVLLVLAHVQEARKQLSDATPSYERAIALLRETQATSQLKEAYAQFSEYLDRRGDSNRAYEMLKQAYNSTLVS